MLYITKVEISFNGLFLGFSLICVNDCWVEVKYLMLHSHFLASILFCSSRRKKPVAIGFYNDKKVEKKRNIESKDKATANTKRDSTLVSAFLVHISQQASKASNVQIYKVNYLYLTWNQ